MQVKDLRTEFIETLDRDDMSEADVDRFFEMGIRRVSRVLKTPIQHKVFTLTADSNTAESVPLPSDLISPLKVSVNGELLSPTTMTDGESQPTDGHPSLYWIELGSMRFRPNLRDGDKLAFVYVGTIERETNPNETTQYSETIPDLILYSSLIYGAIRFVDDQLASYQGMYQALLQEIQIQADLEQTMNAVIQNPYEGMC